MSGARDLAVVIPTLDEADRLPALLDGLRPLGATVVVADGGSTDGTTAVAIAGGARVVEAPRGRARQLRAGAAVTNEPWILFLHADSVIPQAALDALRAFLEEARDDEYAHFRFALDGRRLGYRIIEVGQRLRERLTGLVYGDQGLVVSRVLYERACGYPEWPILEDVGVLERLSRHGSRRRLEGKLLTSPRRYEAEGRFRGWLRNVMIIGMYRLGASPERLARRFPRQPARPHRHEPARSTEASPTTERGRTVIVFAKAPRPGHVKTRLAADVGPEEATRVYRTLGGATVRSLIGGPDRVVVYFDPPEPQAEREVAEWLGREGVAYRAQGGHDLGERMHRAFEECLRDSDEVCIVGTDVPGLGRDRVAEAFRLLADSDIVVGPATDGGYYLLALRKPMPDLFRNVPWSTEAVLETTLQRASETGASVALLEAMTDVDTSVDLPPELLRA